MHGLRRCLAVALALQTWLAQAGFLLLGGLAMLGATLGLVAVLAASYWGYTQFGQPGGDWRQPQQRTDAADSSSHAGRQSDRPDPGSACHEASSRVVDDWVDPQEVVFGLIITEKGSSETAPRPPDLAKWNLDAGASPQHPLFVLGDPHPLLGSWVVRLMTPLSAARATAIIDAMLIADSGAVHGPGCSYAGIEIDHVLEDAGASNNPTDPDYPYQRHLFEDGARFASALQQLDARTKRASQPLSRTVVAVVDSFIDPEHPNLQTLMPADVAPPHAAGGIAGAGLTTASDHGDAVASILFLRPTSPHGVGILRMSPTVAAMLYMPVALPSRDLSTLVRSLLDITANRHQVRSASPLLRESAQIGVINVSRGHKRPQHRANGHPMRLWKRAMTKIHSDQHGPVIVMAAGNWPGMRNALTEGATLSAVGYDQFPPAHRFVPGSTDPGSVNPFSGRAMQVAAKSNMIMTASLLPPAMHLVAGVHGGSSFAAPQVSALAALLRSIDPRLSAEDVRGLIVAGAQQGGRGASSGGDEPDIPVLDAQASVSLLLEHRWVPQIIAGGAVIGGGCALLPLAGWSCAGSGDNGSPAPETSASQPQRPARTR